MRINARVTALVLVYQEQPPDVQENLSAIDASPLLLKVVNCPAVKFNYTISFDRLRTAAQALLEEFPIIGGRLKQVTREEIRKHPYLKSADHCIDLADARSGIVLCEATVDCSSKEVNLHAHLANNFSLLETKVVLPPWHQPMDMSALLKGKEPLLKLQLTHTTDGGCILAASMPHLLADSHSSTLLLTRLAHLYRQLPLSTVSSTVRPGTGAAGLSAGSNASAASAYHEAAAAVGTVAPEGDAGPASVLGAVPSPSRPGREETARHPHNNWSKAALLAAVTGGDPPTRPNDKQSAELKTLSLDLQSTDLPSLCETLGWLAKAVKDARAAAQRHPTGGTLTSRLLSIPPADVLQLKVLAGAGDDTGFRTQISTNDAISALVWLTFCDLRGRDLPGSTSSSHGTPTGGYLGLAIDLRQNCRDLQQHLPENYLGNAAWCVHIDSNCADVPGKGAVKASAMETTDIEMQMTSQGLSAVTAGKPPDINSLVRSLQFAAGAVRGGLVKFRAAAGAGHKLLRLVTEQQAASKRVLVRNLLRLAVSVDGFITSWQFPLQDINFGEGPPTEYNCTVRPTPPWQAAVLPKLGASAAEAGTKILLTVPASAVEGLEDSLVLKQLAPNAAFLI